MQGTIDGFSYGLVTPVAAFLMAWLGAALGLRCTARSLRARRPWKAGGLALGAASLGSGVWTMHFIAMMGFSVVETPIGYDIPTTLASLLLGVLMVGIGIFIVGYRGMTGMALVTGGTITGLGIATMHYLGMAGLRMHGRVGYDTGTVALSVLIAVAAATAALWVTVSQRGILASLTASLVMGIASTGLHYTGMSAVHVHLEKAAGVPDGTPATELLVPMLLGPAVFLLLAGVAVFYDPKLVTGGRIYERHILAGSEVCGRAGVPAQRLRPSAGHRGYGERGYGGRGYGGYGGRGYGNHEYGNREYGDRTAVRSVRRGSPDLHDR
ncbi:MHYT domain-containing protein [Streptomyces sp. NPDC088554]|uniref:MHYT domain-containing protein n=1 Tax=Streptomyces sp. NPDC088554 TaxID=3365865 RepID=UPI00382C8DF1